MKRLFVLCALVASLLAPSVGAAQSPDTPPPTVPRVMAFAGQVLATNGAPRSGPALLTFGFYADQTGGAPLWVEQHGVTLDAEGRYSVVLGSATSDGVPMDVFVAGTSRWIGVAVDTDPEQPRFMLLSVPYALKAADADTVGGRSSTDFVLNTNLKEQVQTVVRETSTTSGGITAAATANYAQKSDGIGGLTDSAIIDVGGKIGIGTATPRGLLNIVGVDNLTQFETTNSGSNAIIRLISPNNGQARVDFGDTDSPTVGRVGYNHLTDTFSIVTNNMAQMTIDSVGRIGLGTASPDGKLNVYAPSGPAKLTLTAADGVNDSFLNFETNNNEWSFGVRKASGNNLVIANSGDITGGGQVLTLTGAGRVGIGTANPTSKLHVAGDVMVDGNIGAKYQDVAEWVEGSEAMAPGTVVTIDATASNRVAPAARAYDSKIAGAVSPQPGVILGEPGPGKVLVAQSGRVRIKADARFGAIRVGDLLVTSPTKGYAMRSRPMKVGGQAMHRPGTILGKALEALPAGKGEILVLLTLQ